MKKLKCETYDKLVIIKFSLSYFTLESPIISIKPSRSQMFFKIGVIKNFANFTGKQLFCSLFLIFPVKFAKFLRTPFLIEHLWCLHLLPLKKISAKAFLE